MVCDRWLVVSTVTPTICRVGFEVESADDDAPAVATALIATQPATTTMSGPIGLMEEVCLRSGIVSG